MFRSLAVNTLISIAAFFIVSIVGLLLVPLLVSTYGIEAFGVIVLLRLLLPTGVLGVLDLGFSETTTLAVAQARVDGSWARASAQGSLLLLLSLITGGALAAVLIFASDNVGAFLNIAPPYLESFDLAVKITGACLLILFPSLVIEGVIKGFEEYRALRMIEVISSLFYAGATLIVIVLKLDYAAVFYTFLGSLLLKSVMNFRIFAKIRGSMRLWAFRSIAGQSSKIFERCRLMGWNKMLGTFQYQVAPFLIGILLTPIAVGAYDILVRLPRFIKSVLGLLNSALLPFAAKLDAAEDAGSMRRLGQTGFLILTILSIPVLSGGAAFSEPILRLWIGPQVEQYWMWQGLMFFIPALNVFVSFGSSALMTRARVLASMNALVTIQLIIQFTLSWFLLDWLDERAFILGQVVATMLTFVPQMFLIFREQGVGRTVVWQALGVAGLAGLMIAAALFFGIPAMVQTLPGLGFALVLWATIFWSAIYLFVLSGPQKARLMRILLQKRQLR